MFGKLSDNEIDEVLTQQVLGHIACHADDLTYIVPISYAYDGERIYARTYEGLKIDLMRKNPKVCFQTDIMENMANWKSVVAWGDFRELTGDAERNSAIEKLLERKITGIPSKTVQLSPLWPFTSKEDTGEIDGIIFSVRLEKKTGRFEKSDSTVF